jgi:hypothetical protein
LCRRASTMEVELERLEGQLSLGQEIDVEAYSRIAQRIHAILAGLGLKRVAKPKDAMKRLITLRQALESKDWLGADSFSVMRTLLITAMGEPLTAEELPTDNRRFAALVEKLTSDTISLKNRIDISIAAIAVIAEELSMWPLATTSGTLFAIGSPHRRQGEMWATYRRHCGPDGDLAILVANGPTKTFNPTIKQSVIDRAYEKDAAVAASEWGGQFQNDLESYVSPEIVDACTDRGVHQIPFNSR